MTIIDHPSPIGYERRPTDHEMIDHAARRIRAGEFEGAHMKCFSREEADELRAYAKEAYPGTRFTFEWLEAPCR